MVHERDGRRADARGDSGYGAKVTISVVLRFTLWQNTPNWDVQG